MELKNAKLCWTKGDYGYKRGVKGKENYPHKDAYGNWYNGYGGAEMHKKMKLDIYGEDSDGRLQKVDVKGYLLESIGKKKMSDKLLDILQSCIPEIVVVDDESQKLSDLTLDQISKKYHELLTKLAEE